MRRSESLSGLQAYGLSPLIPRLAPHFRYFYCHYDLYFALGKLNFRI